MAEIFIDTDERLDTIVGTDLKLVQKIDGTAFAIDTVLLARFVQVEGFNGRVADLGSGSGILSFLLKYRKPALEVVGIEILNEFYQLSLRNLEMNAEYAGLTFENLDIRNVPSKFLPESFEMVVANPPYYQLGTGHLPPKETRAVARHEIAGTLKDFIDTASYLLGYGSKLYLVIPAGRFYEASSHFKEAGFGMRRLQFVRPKEGLNAHLTLIEAERFYNGQHEGLQDLTIHMANGDFSPELQEFFNLGFKRLR